MRCPAKRKKSFNKHLRHISFIGHFYFSRCHPSVVGVKNNCLSVSIYKGSGAYKLNYFSCWRTMGYWLHNWVLMVMMRMRWMQGKCLDVGLAMQWGYEEDKGAKVLRTMPRRTPLHSKLSSKLKQSTPWEREWAMTHRVLWTECMMHWHKKILLMS